MPFTPHSEAQYLVGIHYYVCKGEELKLAAQRARMNPTVLFRAATGWTGQGRDGHAGRAVFVEWLKGLRDQDRGTPCCGAKVVPGTKALPALEPVSPESEALRLAEQQLAELQRQISRLQARMSKPEDRRDLQSPGEELGDEVT